MLNSNTNGRVVLGSVVRGMHVPPCGWGGYGPEVGFGQGNTNISDYLNEIQPVKCEEHSRFIIHCGANC